jgi:CheY-like chemotaxis protein
VDFALNGEEGIAMIKDFSPDLVFMDIHMPVMSGIQATKIIREELNLKDLPIIALSADAFIEQQNKAKDAGVDDYLTKPIEFKKLTRVLDKYLKKRKVLS